MSAQRLQTQWEQEEESCSQLLWSVMGLSYIPRACQVFLHHSDTHGEHGHKAPFLPVLGQGREIQIQRYHIRGLSSALLTLQPFSFFLRMAHGTGIFRWTYSI